MPQQKQKQSQLPVPVLEQKLLGSWEVKKKMGALKVKL